MKPRYISQTENKNYERTSIYIRTSSLFFIYYYTHFVTNEQTTRYLSKFRNGIINNNYFRSAFKTVLQIMTSTGLVEFLLSGLTVIGLIKKYFLTPPLGIVYPVVQMYTIIIVFFTLDTMDYIESKEHSSEYLNCLISR